MWGLEGRGLVDGACGGGWGLGRLTHGGRGVRFGLEGGAGIAGVELGVTQESVGTLGLLGEGGDKHPLMALSHIG